MRFGPRAVPARHALAWAREALALTVRAPLACLALGFGVTAPLALPGRLGDLAFACVPLAIALGVAGARTVDEGRSAWSARVPAPACARLAGVGLAITAAAFAIVAALDTLPADLPSAGWPAPAAAPNPLNDALGIAARATWFWALVAGPTLWFAVPLLALPALPLGTAAVQAFHAFTLNPVLVAVWAAAGAALWLATLVPVLVVPGLALLSGCLYTGYRDVWLGRTDNAPRTRTERTRVRRPAAARARTHGRAACASHC